MKARSPATYSLAERLAKVERALREIRYGSVEITIHNAQLVQLQRTEEVRFEVDGREAASRS